MSIIPKFGLGTSNPVDAAIEIIEYGIVSSIPHLHPDGMQGQVSEVAENAIEGVESCVGPLRFKPSLDAFAVLGPWLGFSESSGAYSLTDSITSRYLTYDCDTKVLTVQGAKVNAWEVSASKGNFWEWMLDVIAEKELTPGNSGTFPSLTITQSNALALHHGTFTLFGSAREIEDFKLRVDNRLDAQSYNAAYVTSIERGDTRKITLSVVVPYTSANADLLRTSIAGAGGSAVFAYGSKSLTFTFGNVQFERGQIEVRGKGRKFIRLNGTARKTGSTEALAMTLDNT